MLGGPQLGLQPTAAMAPPDDQLSDLALGLGDRLIGVGDRLGGLVVDVGQRVEQGGDVLAVGAVHVRRVLPRQPELLGLALELGLQVGRAFGVGPSVRHVVGVLVALTIFKLVLDVLGLSRGGVRPVGGGPRERVGLDLVAEPVGCALVLLIPPEHRASAVIRLRRQPLVLRVLVPSVCRAVRTGRLAAFFGCLR